jgi:hypothetical protein
MAATTTAVAMRVAMLVMLDLSLGGAVPYELA